MSAEKAIALLDMSAEEHVEASLYRVANLYGALGGPYVPRALRPPGSV